MFEDDSIFSSHILDVYKDDEALVQRRVSDFGMDKQWRDKWVNHEEIRMRYERIYNGKDKRTSGVSPQGNMMQGLVSEFMSVLWPNTPGAKLQALKEVDPRLPELERMIRAELIKEAEEANNVVISSMLFENDYRKHLIRAIREAAIYGMGGVRVEEDFSGDPQNNYRLREFMRAWRAGNTTEEQEEDFLMNIGKLSMEWVPAEQIFLEGGRKQFDGNMRRISILEEVNTYALASAYPDLAKEIVRGAGAGFANLSTSDESLEDGWAEEIGASGLDTQSASGPIDVTQVLTTWELVDVWYDIGDTPVPDVVMVRTEIASGHVLLTKEIVTSDGADLPWGGFDPESQEESMYSQQEEGERETEEEDSEGKLETRQGCVKLPITPIYALTSVTHPYGWSIVKQMQYHEDAYNNIMTILMAYSNRNLENGKIFINEASFAEGESSDIQSFLKDPTREVFTVKGSNPYGEEEDIRKKIMSYQDLVAQPPSMLINMAELLLRDFQRLAGLADQSAIARSRSAAGKRTQIAASDRPKTLPVENIAEGVERILDGAYGVFQALYPDEHMVPFLLPGGISGQVQMNQEVTQPLPMLNEYSEPVADPRLSSPENPMGLLQIPATFVVNSNRIPMKAIADNAAGMPHDPIVRTDIARLWLSMGIISPQTARDLSLPQQIKQRDDAQNTRQSMIQQQMQQLQALQGQMAQQGVPMDQAAQAEILNNQGQGPQPVQNAAMQPNVQDTLAPI